MDKKITFKKTKNKSCVLLLSDKGQQFGLGVWAHVQQTNQTDISLNFSIMFAIAVCPFYLHLNCYPLVRGQMECLH